MQISTSIQIVIKPKRMAKQKIQYMEHNFINECMMDKVLQTNPTIFNKYNTFIQFMDLTR